MGAALAVSNAMGSACAQSNPNWRSYAETGKVADIVGALQWNTWFGLKLDVNGGKAQNLTITGGSISEADLSAGLALANGGTTSRLFSDRFADYINVRDQGVKCDGQTDDTAAINAIFVARIQRKRVVFPAGTCLFSGTLTFNLNSSSVVGGGSQATQFVYTGLKTNIDLIDVPGGYNPVVQGFSVWSQTKMTAGAAIHISQTSYGWLKDVVATYLNTSQNTLWNGLYIDQPNFVSVDGYYFQAQNDALVISALGIGTPYQYDVFLNNGKLSESAVGMHVAGGIDNVHADNTEITTNAINVLDDNALVAQKNQEIFLGKHVVTDQAIQWNYYINDAKCSLANYGIVEVAGPVTAAKTYDNIYVKSFPGCELVVSSPYVTAAKRDGIRSADGSAILAVAPQTLITANGEFGVNAEFAWSKVLSIGQLFGNVGGSYGPNVVPPALSNPSTPTYTLATVPACGASAAVGARAYLSDMTKPGESAGSGTGGPAFCSAAASSGGSSYWASQLSGKQATN
ncbi:hypothetical protein A0U89_06935 [Kozakia baliensis]|uniref:Rhamnogalacturonase A/B/Epimerase-like pectate lyase domain-containing protein n=2 Tax=Kozakia baliensis TaxID=153496 RepID=A0A1D8UTD9_9PROT|nr:hypothetical protein A0U89_06935 [Kozakia baliensis]